jgi:hypothetical protein
VAPYRISRCPALCVNQRTSKGSCHICYYELVLPSLSVSRNLILKKISSSEYYEILLRVFGFCSTQLNEIWPLCYHKFALLPRAARQTVYVLYKHDIWPPAANVQSNARIIAFRSWQKGTHSEISPLNYLHVFLSDKLVLKMDYWPKKKLSR